ncbi:hypothetical protein C8R44DRAFT_659535 [Mycena epipterygia]|nr:hypothetical protein C8R44DRAFT_659535 [Mycena epipterygia]
MPASEPILDLYDLALLLNYERASAEPRFRHAKLREVASASSPFKTVSVPIPEWTNCTTPKDGFIFDVIPPKTAGERDLPDVPSNMLVAPVRDALRKLTPKQLETIFWQVRGHDGCFKSIALIQHFFDLYPINVKIRIRTPAGTEFITDAFSRNILEMTLLGPRLMTLACVIPSSQYITGDEDTMIHSVMEFPDSLGGSSMVLDMASLQFGDAGRGVEGRSTFVLESRDSFTDRLRTRIAHGVTFTKVSQRIGGCPDDPWLKPIAAKVKARLEKRQIEPWCGHCGAPGPDLKKCSLCQEASYCDQAHQVAAWPFHKKFCAGKKNASN